MIVEMKQMITKKWNMMLPMNGPIDNDLSTGFVISIKPKSLNFWYHYLLACYISFDQTNDSRW